MVVVRLRGGLGNQMFQYATARAVALRNGAELVLDARDFAYDAKRDYALKDFPIEARVPRPEELPPDSKAGLRYAWWKFRARRGGRLCREKGTAFEPRVLSLGGDAILHGYWQSERYFADHAETIRAELTPATPPSAENAACLKRIGSTRGVSVHVRRGDYVSDAKAQGIFASLKPDYYAEAAREMFRRLGQVPEFYVFSDDPDWAEAELKLPGPKTVVRHNDGRTAFEDLRLMSACRHHIIANSSFSWWGAWLNPSPDKIVIAPARWYGEAQKDNPDIVPDRWIRL